MKSKKKTALGSFILAPPDLRVVSFTGQTTTGHILYNNRMYLLELAHAKLIEVLAYNKPSVNVSSLSPVSSAECRLRRRAQLLSYSVLCPQLLLFLLQAFHKDVLNGLIHETS